MSISDVAELQSLSTKQQTSDQVLKQLLTGELRNMAH